MDRSRLSEIPLFQGLDKKEFERVSMSMNITEKKFEAGEVVLAAGSRPRSACLVLEGRVAEEYTDLWGNRLEAESFREGELFAEGYSLMKSGVLPTSFKASEQSRILFIGIGNLTEQSRLSSGQQKVLFNLLNIANTRNRERSMQLIITSPKSARSRIMSYLSRAAAEKGKTSFDIPLDRQQMADYLRLDRTALSKELGKMKREGLIDFRKNRFRILHQS